MTEAAGGGFVTVGASVFSARQRRPKWQSRPWRTRAIWSTRFQRWEADVYPGYVNAIDPTCHGYLRDDEEGKARALDLADRPRIPLWGFRKIDGQGEGIPAFFKARGVRKDRGFQIQGEKVVLDITPEDPTLPARRYLKAADIWVAVARPTYQLDVDIQGNLLTGQIVDYQVGFDISNLSRLGARPRLLVGELFPPPPPPPTLQDRLTGIYGDEGDDRQIISTIYLLSPPEEPEAELARWRPYVKHHCGWNLLHAAKNDPPKNTRQTSVDSGLMAFVGRYTIVPQATQGVLEAEQQRILAAILNTTSNEGKFWTI
jgi:hypothetical protein